MNETWGTKSLSNMVDDLNGRIDARELRLGNWVHEGQINSFWESGINLRYGKSFRFSELTPIPLTEEILVKCGFVKLPHFTIQNSLLYDLGRGRYLSIGNIEDCNQMLWLQNIEGDKVADLVCLHNYDYDGWLYFHKLQNIIYSLTGSELEIYL